MRSLLTHRIQQQPFNHHNSPGTVDSSGLSCETFTLIFAGHINLKCSHLLGQPNPRLPSTADYSYAKMATTLSYKVKEGSLLRGDFPQPPLSPPRLVPFPFHPFPFTFVVGKASSILLVEKRRSLLQ